jgi:hypothetical protein
MIRKFQKETLTVFNGDCDKDGHNCEETIRLVCEIKVKKPACSGKTSVPCSSITGRFYCTSKRLFFAFCYSGYAKCVFLQVQMFLCT